MIFYIVVSVAILLALYGGGTKAVSYRKAKAIAHPTDRDKYLSIAGKKIVSEYNLLPAESRPFDDVVPLIQALDVKHTKDGVNSHFRDYGYGFSWNCNCGRYGYREECPFSEYKTLRDEIVGVRKDLEEQQHALEVAKVQGELDAVASLLTHLRQERKILQEVTKETQQITGGQ